MAEINNDNTTSPLLSKRTLNSVQIDEDNNPKKSKFQSCDNNNLVVEDPDENQENPTGNDAVGDPEEVGKAENEEKSANGERVSPIDGKGKGKLIEEEREEKEIDDEDEKSANGKEVIDRKGKGILIEEAEEEHDSDEDEEKSANGKGAEVIDRKGKGILIEEDEDSDDEGDDDDDDDDSDDDDDDDDDDGVELSDGDAELSDDPLAEVDLDNILPSRTRRRVVNPGAYDASILAGIDSDSDDSDA